jgi:hypothetical protein
LGPITTLRLSFTPLRVVPQGFLLLEYTTNSALSFFLACRSGFLPGEPTFIKSRHTGANMSLIKAADVPKHMADRLRSRRIGARLSRGTSKQPILSEKKAIVAPTTLPGTPAIL